MSFGSEVKGFFSHLWTDIKPGLKTGLVNFEQKVTPNVFTLMTDAVELEASTTVGGVVARDAAVAKFVADAKTAGIAVEQFATYELNALCELAVVAVKNKITSAVPQPAASAPAAAATGATA